MKRYTIEQFVSKYQNQRHITCAIHYEDGNFDTMFNSSCSQVLSYIRDKKVAYIVSR